ncbi:MAG: CubicO group peptidase (beta-lactamase class C family) [Flammeovirgaceae bacterium]|jgi:CubicO group peptidase (beta-lactamase class C family)
MKTLFFRILFFSCCFIGLISFHPPLGYQQEIAKSKREIKRLVRKQKVPGLAIAISVDGKTVWKEGFGYANKELSISASPDSSQFRIASISKSLTATALAILYEQEKIDLDEKIREHVSYFPKKQFPITIRQVGGHLAGIRSYEGNEFLSNKNYNSVQDGLGIFKDDPLEFKPKTDYLYSSYGFNLLSAVVEEASETDFLDFMQSTIFQPLQMENTCADKADSLLTNRVAFYSKSKRNIESATPVDNSYKWAGGGFLSSASDLLKFGNAILGNKLIQESTLDEFTTAQKKKNGKSTYYGIGWQNWKDPNGFNWFGHSGGGVGATTQFLIQPDKRIVIVILSNLSDVNMEKTLEVIASSFTKS